MAISKDTRLFFLSMWVTLLLCLFVSGILLLDETHARPDRGGGHPALALTEEHGWHVLHLMGRELRFSVAPLKQLDDLRRANSVIVTPRMLRLLDAAWHWGTLGWSHASVWLGDYFYQLEVIDGKI